MQYGKGVDAFQLTTSRGGRRSSGSQSLLVFHFNSRPHEEVDDGSDWQVTDKGRISTHDLTRRSTNLDSARPTTTMHFNSRPHEEVDLHMADISACILISTHDLTRRSTPLRRSSSRLSYISTHDLTRRSTITSQNITHYHTHFNSRPHEEVDWNYAGGSAREDIFQLTTSRGGRQIIHIASVSILQFQLTTSRGGRPMMVCQRARTIYHFNSRPHEEVDENVVVIAFQIFSFQLTTSRGGRLLRNYRRLNAFYISTHDLTRRSTGRTISILLCCFTFQLTTSRGGRPICSALYLRNSKFQLTTSRGGRLSSASATSK